MTSTRQSREEMGEDSYQLILNALEKRKPVRVEYEGCLRSICPHVIGRNAAGALRVFAYQYSGTSRSGLAEGGGWRCLALDQLREVEILDEPWRSEPHAPQRCVQQVEAEALSGTTTEGTMP